MNAMLPLTPTRSDKAANLLSTAKALAPILARSRPLDRKLLSSTMTMCFGLTDAEGGWIWKDAYDASEAALVMQVRRLGQQFARLEDAPADIMTLAAAQTALCLTQTRRSDEQVQLDQFSTPLELASACVLAAQIRAGDKVLEPSAGTGLIAILAEVCGGTVSLNELASTRADILQGVFSGRPVTRHDGAHLHDLLPSSGSFDAVVANPPFQHLDDHLDSALRCLADGGRLAAIVPVRAFSDADLLKRLEARGSVIGMIAFPANAYSKHGTSVATGLIVVDRTPATTLPLIVETHDFSDLAKAIQGLAERPTARPRLFRSVAPSGFLNAGARLAGNAKSRSALFASVAPVDYSTKPWAGQTQDVGVFQAYQVGRIACDAFPLHPSSLVESSAMGTTSPPAPTYRPVLPAATLDKRWISLEQFEVAVYAGEAHSEMLPGWWLVDKDQPHKVQLVAEGTPEAVQFRKAFFVGDGTGVGKGTSSAAVLADNFSQGRSRAIWISKNETLLEDARRDWMSIGGSLNDIVPQSRWKQGEAVTGDFCLFTTYGTLRQPARGDKKARLKQIVEWLGPDFDGLIIFDEAHAMANAAGGGEGARGLTKPSLQGQAGLALQNLLPKARVLLVSATGATTPENLAYASRLGLWGGPDAPFATREAFLDVAASGGISMMELVARDLKAAGLYLARSISMDGVEVDPLIHELTPTDIEIWDAWARGFEIIHNNMQAALELTGVIDGDGATVGGSQLSAARSAFASCAQRFFNALLCGMKAPTVIGAIKQHLAAGDSCVIQLVSTNEAALDRRLEDVGPGAWNNLNIDLTPRDAVFGYLERSFPTGAHQEVKDERGNVSIVPLTDGDGNRVHSQEALEIRDQLLLDLACLPAVPGALDAILHAFGPDSVAEVTGRSKRVLMRHGRQVVERRSSSSNRAETDAFQSGRKKILVFSDAGGTGRSYHADANCLNQARRCHMLVEGGWRADNAIQGLGRTNRTNQVHPPLFRPVATTIVGEKRFLSTIARRLDSMGALTRGERRSTSNGLFRAEDNLETPWARRAQLALFTALRQGKVEGMTIDDFERKTALTLRTPDGLLHDAENMPALTQFMNRVLALSIGDQNTLFASFDALHAGILEKARQDGTLDKGLEDITPAELDLASEEVIRTDAATGAETRLTTFLAKTRRAILSSAQAMAERAAYRQGSASFMVNKRSGGAALVVRGQTMVDDHDDLQEAVRIIQPTDTRLSPLDVFNESAWEPCSEALWRSTWDQKVLETDPWQSEELHLVSGLMLPIWKLLPSHGKAMRVKRLCAPDGRRWLGRLIDSSEAMQLRQALGVAGAVTYSAEDVLKLVLEQGNEVELAAGYWLRRRRVMDRYRIELDNAVSARATFVPMGVMYELIAFQARPFVPIGRPEVLAKIIATFPVQAVHALTEAA